MVKKILKILGVVLAVLFAGIYFSYDYWLEKELKYRLSEIINKDPNGLYQYSFSKLNINLMDGSVDLKGIIILPAESAFDSLMSETNQLRFLLQLEMDEIQLNGFEITEFMKTGDIIVESLIISEPNFEYFFHPGKKQAKHAMPLSNVFSKNFKTAELGKFLINSAEIRIVDQTKSGPTTTIHQLNIEFSEARVDSNTLQSYLPFEHENLSINAAGLSIDAGKLFSITSDSLFFKVEDNSFGLTNFQINPKYSQENFTKLYDEQKQWFAIKLDSLILNHINIDTFVHTGHIEVGKVEVITPNIALYKDKSKSPPPFKKKLLPASAIKSIPWILEIDSVSIRNGYVSINETSGLTGQDSHLTFNELNGLLTNFNNDTSGREESTIMALNATTLVQNKALTAISIQFDLESPHDEFSVQGSVGSVVGSTFNPVLEPMMGVKVTGGIINSLEFSFTANDSISTGTLDMDYEKIKLEILNAKSDKKTKKGFMTFAANTAIKSNNRIEKSTYLQGVIITTRVQEKDVWPYIWHSIQAGLVSTLAPFTNSKEEKQQQKEVRKEMRDKEN
jgi:hypothetical protein